MECFRYDYPISVAVKDETITGNYWSTGDCQQSIKGIKCNSASNQECTVNFDVDIQPDHIKNSTLTETMFYGKTSVWEMQTLYNMANSRPNGSLDFTGT